MTSVRARVARSLPCVQWMSDYDRERCASDLIAAMIVTVLLIPQSLAYAMIAGVPAEVGLYASILPLIVYALLGSSRTLSVGPVAVISLMTAMALNDVAQNGTVSYLLAASTLAFLSGGILLAFGALRMGFIANFISHSVISGFITASGVLIAFNQVQHLMGVQSEGGTISEILPSLFGTVQHANSATIALGVSVLIMLVLVRAYAIKSMAFLGLSERGASLLAKVAPMIIIIGSLLAVFMLDLTAEGVAVVGSIPSGLPQIAISMPDMSLIQALLFPACLISVIGYVESVSVGKTLAAKRQQKINPNQELVALGASNLAAGLSGAFPVTGGFSRSVVNFDAGALTQAASLYTAVGIAACALFLAPSLYYLPKAALAATIIVAVLSLVDLNILKKTWSTSKSDFLAVMITIVLTLSSGVEVGVASGIAVSIALHLYRTSRPHIAEVGLVPGSEHFRNVRHYRVETLPHVLAVRMDESLFFANASYLEDWVSGKVFENDRIAHVVLMCSAINEIDYSAVETLEQMNEIFKSQGVQLHLSEVKGPVLTTLKRHEFLKHLSGRPFLSQFEAHRQLAHASVHQAIEKDQ
ncbi:MAG: SulP family inorganic anion transporter [Pseudomonadales bacterium]